MKDFSHHNVLSLIGVCFHTDELQMVVILLMTNGDLLSYIRNEAHHPTVKQLLTFAIQVRQLIPIVWKSITSDPQIEFLNFNLC